MLASPVSGGSRAGATTRAARPLGRGPADRCDTADSATTSFEGLSSRNPWKGGVAKSSVLSPVGEGTLRHENRLDPVHSALARRIREGGRRSLKTREAAFQVQERFPGEAGADLAAVTQAVPGLTDAEEQRAEPDPGSACLGKASDHELLAGRALRFEPGTGPAGDVGPVGTLGNDSLETAAARAAIEFPAVAHDVVAVAEHPTLPNPGGKNPFERLLSFQQRDAGQVVPVAMQDIEDEKSKTPFVTPPQCVLKRLKPRAPVGLDDCNLAVQHGALDGKRRRSFGDAFEALRPVTACARQERCAPPFQATEEAIAVVLDLVNP